MSNRFNISDHRTIARSLLSLGLTLEEAKFWPRYNVSPMTALWAAYAKFEKPKLTPVEWAMVPPWAKPDQFPKPLTIARAETVWERASFKNLIPRYRAIVPVNGFYLWTKKSPGSRRVWHVHREDGDAFGIGAIRQFNVDGIMQICTLTTDAADTFPEINQRLPVIVNEANFRQWLNTERRAEVESMLLPSAGAGLVADEVDARAADPRFEDPSCIAPIETPGPADS